MAQTVIYPAWQVADANGVPLPGALLYSYEAGTSTPLPLYVDEALTVPLPNPVVADSAGRFPALYAQPQDYRLDLFTAGGSLVWTRDPVPVSNVIGAALITALDLIYVRIDRANADWLSLGGGTMTGLLVLSGDATAPLGAVTKQQLEARALPVFASAFLTSGVWAKPAGYGGESPVLIRCWGAGGSGRRDSTIGNAGGGGGGGYTERWARLGDLGPTETVTIGAGGAAKTGSNADGDVGGTTSFGSHLSAFGGGGGSAGRGGGGGYFSAGATGTGNAVGTHGLPGLPRYVSVVGTAGAATYTFAGSGAYDDTLGNLYPAQPGDRHGGGGGGAVAGGPGGSSVYGGGGGGCNGAAGGTSLFGGPGGASAATGVAGAAPGGGGGGGSTTSGAGGGGLVRVFVFPSLV